MDGESSLAAAGFFALVRYENIAGSGATAQCRCVKTIRRHSGHFWYHLALAKVASVLWDVVLAPCCCRLLAHIDWIRNNSALSCPSPQKTLLRNIVMHLKTWGLVFTLYYTPVSMARSMLLDSFLFYFIFLCFISDLMIGWNMLVHPFIKRSS